MSYAVLCNYENYYNRRCLPPKRLVDDYRDYIIHVTPSSINFNPNDGINTELVVNWDGEHPNYLLINEIGGLVASRWYVLEATHLRSGQLRLSLRRDLFADYYDDVLYAPAMIERGRLSAYDPYIFNDEGIRFNQIKTNEWLLKDETQIPWLVGYMVTETDTNSITIPSATPVQADYNWSDTLDTWYYYSFPIQDLANVGVGYRIRGNSYNTIDATSEIIINVDGTTSYTEYPEILEPGLIFNDPSNIVTLQIEQRLPQTKPSIDSIAKQCFLASKPDFSNQAVLNLFKTYNDKLLQTTDGLWKMKLVVDENFSISYPLQDTTNPTFAALRNLTDNIPSILGTPNENTYDVRAIGKAWRLDFEEYTAASSYVIPISNQRRRVSDAPYSMFAIPFGEISIDYSSASSIKADKWAGLSSAIYMAEKLGSQLYDLQILPYCPIREIVGSRLNLRNSVEGVDYSIINQNIGQGETSPVSMIFWASSTQFSFDITRLELPPYDPKVTNQCTMRRLCSPNYSAIYEFNEAKLKGIAGFNVDCAYKPFSPYIHVWPKGGIGSLYGEDFNDPRGLICSGDFSVSRVTDAWIEYELSNKNFQNIFNRQIETMELTHNVRRSEQIANMIVGSVGAGATGAGGAAMFGLGGVGMGITAAASTAASIGAGIVDITIQDRLSENERDQAGDMFRMSNENIQARPDTLTKVSAFNPNNKFFPVLETYSATEQEIAAFQNFIQWNGMKVGRIGTVNEFIWPDESYIQGRIIRFPDTLRDDAHIALEINNELMKGVYMKQ